MKSFIFKAILILIFTAQLTPIAQCCIARKKSLPASRSPTRSRSQVLNQFLNYTSDAAISRPPECIHDVPVPKIPIYIDVNNAMKACVEEWKSSPFNWKLPHPDQDRRINEVIVHYGYILETFNFTSVDGYITTIFRVPGGPSSPQRRGKPTVLLIHGLGAGSDQWILQYGNRNLLFKLVEAHYDVWVVCLRGTDLSLGHTRLSSTQPEYWDYSLHEMAVNDIAPIVDLVNTETENERTQVICHSLGCSLLTIALSEVPEVNTKLHAAYLLAPAVFIGHLYNPSLRFLTAIYESDPRGVMALADLVIQQGIFTQLTRVLRDICAQPKFRCTLCINIISYMYGSSGGQTNFTNIPNLFKTVNTFSTRTIDHLRQNYVSCLFRKFDFGNAEDNYRAYGSFQPPPYDLSRVTVPTYIFYGLADNFVTPLDVAILRDALPEQTVKGFHQVNWTYFNHVDFMIAKDADVLLYDTLLRIMDEYITNENMIFD